MKRRKRGDDSHQMRIGWGSPPAEPASMPIALASAEIATRFTRADFSHSSTLVQALPWDFVNSFPSPLPEAIEAGHLLEEDSEWQNLKALHDVHASEMTALLDAHDRIIDARRRGVDSTTGKRPKSLIATERCRSDWQQGPPRLLNAYEALLGVYADSFGLAAADAFEKAVHARRAGVEVREAESKHFVDAVRRPVPPRSR